MSEISGPSRRVKVEGAYNVRDVGAYTTQDGRRTRWKTFLRADSLYRLSPDSQTALIEYGVRTVIDLRTTPELQEEPNPYADSPLVHYHHLNMDGDVPPSKTPDYKATRDPLLVEMMAEVADAPTSNPAARRVQAATLGRLESYGSRLDRHRPKIRDIMATMAAPGGLPALVHCAAGTDRTGIISALVLGIARVPANTIAADYALSATGLLERDMTDKTPREIMEGDHTWQRYQQVLSPSEAMAKVLEYLDRRYDGIEAYVRGIGLTSEQIESLRSSMLESLPASTIG